MQGSDQLSLPSATTRWTNRARSAACFAAFVPAVILNNQALPEILALAEHAMGGFRSREPIEDNGMSPETGRTTLKHASRETRSAPTTRIRLFARSMSGPLASM